MDIDEQPIPDSQGVKPNPLIPKSAVKSVNDLSSKLDHAVSGVDGVADDLDKKLVQGLDKVEKSLDGFINGLDKFLSKF